jgi:hypothetical protein
MVHDAHVHLPAPPGGAVKNDTYRCEAAKPGKRRTSRPRWGRGEGAWQGETVEGWLVVQCRADKRLHFSWAVQDAELREAMHPSTHPSQTRTPTAAVAHAGVERVLALTRAKGHSSNTERYNNGRNLVWD